MTADQRPAQQDPQWDPTLADPLFVEPEWQAEAEAALADYRHRRARRTFLGWTFAALLVILAILAAALLVAAPR